MYAAPSARRAGVDSDLLTVKELRHLACADRFWEAALKPPMSSPHKSENTHDNPLWRVEAPHDGNEANSSSWQTPAYTDSSFYASNATQHDQNHTFNLYGFGPVGATSSSQTPIRQNDQLRLDVQVQGLSPVNCTAANAFTIRISSSTNLMTRGWSYAVFFDTYHCPASISFIGHGLYGHFFALHCQAPFLDPSHMTPVSIYLSITDDTGVILSYTYAGIVNYDHFRHARDPSPIAPGWTVAGERQQLHSYQTYNIDMGVPQTSASYPPYSTLSHHGFPSGQYPLSYPTSRAPTTAEQPDRLRDRQPMASALSHLAQARGRSPERDTRRSEYRVSKRYARTPEPTTSRHRTMAVRAGSANPPLVRASKLRTHRVPREPSQTPAFSQYSTRKTDLRLQGDLAAMSTGWTTEEKEAKRRLIEFERKQEDPILSVAFKSVDLDSRQPNSICISCVWCGDNDETYITSVDCIYLLESLVGSRFTVEEKNRVRRNLEGFKPRTVSKRVKNRKQSDKTDEELKNDELFDVIMGFPDPKPRNIEKDIKVFPWKILPDALKKVLSKFTADYASVVGYLHPSSSGSSDKGSSVSPSDSPTSYRPTSVSAEDHGGSSVRVIPMRRLPTGASVRPLLRVQTSTTEPIVTSRPSSFRQSPLELSPQAGGGSSSWHLQSQSQQPYWTDLHTSFDLSRSAFRQPHIVASASRSPPSQVSQGDALRDFEGPQPSLWDV